jgi:hypothetical protein
MSLNFEEVNVLGNIINDTFGRPSTQTGYSSEKHGGNLAYGGYAGGGTGTANTVATKASLQGEILTVTSLAVINLANLHTQHQEIAKVENELNQHIKGYISHDKKVFTKKEKDGGAGRALKCKQVKNSERNSVEMLNHYQENRRAIVRRSIDFEVS